MTDFDISLEEYMNISSNFDANFENYEVCESLLLQVEEGFMEKIKSGFKKIYEKFHKIFTDFKNWVKRIIKRIRSFFKKDEENVDTEKAKEDISRVEDVLKTAEGVDKDLADALDAKGSKRDSEEYQNKADEMRELKKKADESVSEMKEVKETVSKTYSTESGDKERKLKDEPKWNIDDEDYDYLLDNNVKKYLKSNPFGSKNRQKTFSLEVTIVEKSECLKNNINPLTYEPIKNIKTGGRYIGDVIYSVADIASYNEYEASVKAFQYVISTIPNSYIKAYIQSHKNEYTRLKKNTSPEFKKYYYEGLFILNPSISSLNEYINVLKSEESD